MQNWKMKSISLLFFTAVFLTNLVAVFDRPLFNILSSEYDGLVSGGLKICVFFYFGCCSYKKLSFTKFFQIFCLGILIDMLIILFLSIVRLSDELVASIGTAAIVFPLNFLYLFCFSLIGRFGAELYFVGKSLLRTVTISGLTGLIGFFILAGSLHSIIFFSEAPLFQFSWNPVLIHVAGIISSLLSLSYLIIGVRSSSPSLKEKIGAILLFVTLNGLGLILNFLLLRST